MVSSNKILTVSYGTFSCTLEGFDDSFGTMKAIAEYFRDLAQDDRYFGAEPPTPDADMLARIAEREIARRVDARVENGGYVLRPSLGGPAADPAPAAEPQAAPEPDAAPQAPGTAMATALAAQRAMADDAMAKAKAEAEAEAMAKAETEAAAKAEAETEAAAKAEAETEAAKPAEAEAAEHIPASAPSVEEEPQSETAASQILADDAGDVADEDTSAFFAAPADRVAAPSVTTDSNSVAAKLQRIRAVVSASGGPLPAYSEDEHADAFLTDTAQDDGFEDDALNAMMAEEAPVSDPAPEADPEAASEAETAFDAEDDDDADTLGENLFTDTIASFVAEHDDLDDGADERDAPQADTADMPEDTAEDTADADPETSEAAQDEDAQLRPRARLLRVKRADYEAAISTDPDADEAAEPAPVSSLSAEEEADLARELAEVEAELDEAWESVEEDDTEEDVAARDLSTGPDSPGPDDLDAPRRDTGLRLRKDGNDDAGDDAGMLAAVSRAAKDGAEAPQDAAQRATDPAQDGDDADDTDDLIERHAIEGARKTLRLSSPAHAMLTQNKIEEDDTSVSRILDETNTQLEEPEGNRRRSAIAHLRAAVAATRADRILGRKADPEKETEPYRADLANAVRPRRPMPAPAARSERPAAPRPAPLKLVAEQRVDAPPAARDATPAAPVRPRRVTRSPQPETAETDEDSGFVAFAEDMGATDLPDLLEAAAAYMSFVEGRDQFSRPQLMTKVRQAEQAESSREDRLRSFGQLLREGKIEKTHGGRFTASEQISFKPGARAAG